MIAKGEIEEINSNGLVAYRRCYSTAPEPYIDARNLLTSPDATEASGEETAEKLRNLLRKQLEIEREISDLIVSISRRLDG